MCLFPLFSILSLPRTDGIVKPQEIRKKQVIVIHKGDGKGGKKRRFLQRGISLYTKIVGGRQSFSPPKFLL